MANPNELLTRAAGLSDPADGLAAIRELRVHLARLEATHVENGLRAGWRWSDVAAALDLSKQAAHRRYAIAMRERLDAVRGSPPARLAALGANPDAARAAIAALGDEPEPVRPAKANG